MLLVIMCLLSQIYLHQKQDYEYQGHHNINLQKDFFFCLNLLQTYQFHDCDTV